MSQHKSDQELISLDRLNTLKDRVLSSITEYKTLLDSLSTSFKGSDTELISNLQIIEQEKIKVLTNRVHIFNTHIKDIEKKSKSINNIKTEVYTNLESLKDSISGYKTKFDKDLETLDKEIKQVKNRIKPMGKGSGDSTAQRIDIIT